MEWEGPFFFSLLTDFFLVVGKHSIDNSQFLSLLSYSFSHQKRTNSSPFTILKHFRQGLLLAQVGSLTSY